MADGHLGATISGKHDERARVLSVHLPAIRRRRGAERACQSHEEREGCALIWLCFPPSFPSFSFSFSFPFSNFFLSFSFYFYFCFYFHLSSILLLTLIINKGWTRFKRHDLSPPSRLKQKQQNEMKNMTRMIRCNGYIYVYVFTSLYVCDKPSTNRATMYTLSNTHHTSQ